MNHAEDRAALIFERRAVAAVVEPIIVTLICNHVFQAEDERTGTVSALPLLGG